MDTDFILTKMALEELRKMGYREVWLGNVDNPHWNHGCSHGIVASPRRRESGWPALWQASEQTFGRQGAGNGLGKADNTFRTNVSQMISGHYVLIDGQWNPD